MKNFFYLILMFVSTILVGQEQTRLEQAVRHLEGKVSEYGLTKDELGQMQVSSMYTSTTTGATHIYLNQALGEVLIKNAMVVVTIDKNGRVVHTANSCVPNVSKRKIESGSKIAVEDAAVYAALHLGVSDPEKPKLISRSADGNGTLTKTRYTRSEIRVKPVYELRGEDLVLTHELTMEMADNADYWEIRISAKDGTVIDKNNLTVYCNHDHGKYNRNESCETQQIVQINAEKSASVMEALQSDASYRVFKFPAESPNHGAHELVRNPHNLTASPFGWHDTNGAIGAEFTTTRGNNAFAFSDQNDDDIPDVTPAPPSGGANLFFDYKMDFTKEPVTNSDASIVNLFYANNMLHDITYLYGFNEEAGNFQQRNYSTKGRGNDFVNASAFDGFTAAEPKLNNANFSTPNDGSTPRMQMFLWTKSAGAISVTSPKEELTNFDLYGTAAFGFRIPTATDKAIEGSIAMGTDATNNPSQVCQPIIQDLTGKIAIVYRGGCDFSTKIFRAQQKGAVACIVCNIRGVNGGNGEELLSMGAGANATQVNIPSVFFRASDCQRLANLITKGVDVKLKFQEQVVIGPRYKDASLDNGIIAHEYGHGISNRLTGGPANSSCLSNNEQMGEGWSDFFALITSVKAGDKGENARGIGTFANGEPVNGRGIRRFPYSTDMKINPQTFDNIKGTTAPHPLGEVWTDMLWDLYWAMAAKYGFDADIANVNSGNGKAIQLVMEGMKLQACLPGFIEGRDAINIADLLLNDGANECLIWEVFARRGLGYNAIGGNTANRNDGIQDFEVLPTCIEKLKIEKNVQAVALAGQIVEVSLKVTNHVKKDLKKVFVEDELPEGSSYVAGSSSLPSTLVGRKIRIEVGDMDYLKVNTLKYSVRLSSQKSSTIKLYDIDSGINDWDVNVTKGVDTWQVKSLGAKSGNDVMFIEARPEENDHSLITPNIKVSGQVPVLRFFHKYNTQPINDGGYVQISDNNGNSWQSLDDKYLRNGPQNSINYSTFAIPDLRGFTGTTNGLYVDTYIDLATYKGKDVKIRFRFGSDTSVTVPNGGWWIDDVELMDITKAEGLACTNDQTLANEACTIKKVILINSDVALSNEADKIDEENFKIYPNPTQGVVNLIIDQKISNVGRVTIFGVDGRAHYTKEVKVFQGVNVINLDISTVPNGIYLVEFKTSTGRMTSKLVVY
jgi:hypothetical protein